MSTATTTNKLSFAALEAAPLSKSLGAELFRVPELSDPGFDPVILVNQRRSEPRQETVTGFALSFAEIDSQNADSLKELAKGNEIKRIYAVNLDMYTVEGLAHAEENGVDPRPSASVRLDYASPTSNQIRVKAGIGLPVPYNKDSNGKNQRSQFPDWDKLAEIESDIDESFIRRVSMAAFQALAKKDPEMVGKMVEAMQPAEEAPQPTESTTQGPSSLAGLANTQL